MKGSDPWEVWTEKIIYMGTWPAVTWIIYIYIYILVIGHFKSRFSGLFYVCISVWDSDLDLIIDGNLSTEISLVVLDTLAVVEQVYQKPLRD